MGSLAGVNPCYSCRLRSLGSVRQLSTSSGDAPLRRLPGESPTSASVKQQRSASARGSSSSSLFPASSTDSATQSPGSTPSYLPSASSWMPAFAVRPRPQPGGVIPSVQPLAAPSASAASPSSSPSSSPSPSASQIPPASQPSSSPQRPSFSSARPSFPASPHFPPLSVQRPAPSPSAAAPQPHSPASPPQLSAGVAFPSRPLFRAASSPFFVRLAGAPAPPPHLLQGSASSVSEAVRPQAPSAAGAPWALPPVSSGTPPQAQQHPAGGASPHPPAALPVVPHVPCHGKYSYHRPPMFEEGANHDDEVQCFHTSLESDGSLLLSGGSPMGILSSSVPQRVTEELQIQRIHRDVSSRSLPAPVLVGRLYTLASFAAKYTMVSACLSSASSTSSFVPANSLFAGCLSPSGAAAAAAAAARKAAPLSLVSTAGLVAGALWGRVPELEVTDVPPLLDGVSVLLLLHQQQLQRERQKKMEALVAAPSERQAAAPSSDGTVESTQQMERDSGAEEETRYGAAGLQLRLVARILLDRLEELLHLLRIDEVSRAAWHAACVLPPSVVSPFFFYAVDLRMGDAICLLASEGANNPELFDQLLPVGSSSKSLASRPAVPAELGADGGEEKARARLAALARVLHPFAAKPLINKVSFLRSAPMLQVVSRLLEATKDPDSDTLVRLLHLYGHSVQARRLVTSILSRLNIEGDADLPDAVLVDVSLAAGAGELPHNLTSACVRRLLSRAAQGMHTHALAESVLALAGHLTLEQLLDLATPLRERAELLSARQQAALLLLYSQSCVAATDLLRALETHLLASMETLPVDLFARTALAFSMSTSVSLLTVNKIADTVQAHALANTISPERLVDVTLALAVAGRQNLRCWDAFGVSTRIADFSWRSLPILAWIFAMTDYREVSAWQSIALLIPQFAAELSMVQRSQLYEAFTAARLIGFFNAQDQVPELTTRLASWRRYWTRLRCLPSSSSKIGGRHAVATGHEKSEDDEKRHVGNPTSPVPYDAMFYVAKIPCVQGRETELYPIPFLVPQYNLIFEPLDATPIHQGTGMKLGEVALRHRVWSAMGFSILTVMHSEFQQFFESARVVDRPEAAGDAKSDDGDVQKAADLQMVLEDGRKFNVGAASKFLTSRIENVARQASTLDCWLSVLKGGAQMQLQTSPPVAPSHVSRQAPQEQHQSWNGH
ncbi:hypothetical protein BESB_065560 [Besnoitia besnoiti]|uniref:RAP domain-containing protein n=1 Tax=Besnoitia besnoiti TaxID=94643 RepID=A0A2A9MBC9_BESBE|nr:hypothetical protein BESB_065560 [Besnoitia besnoiti]PFH34524.1 hypothetical protein BESB_065560 [Besnoitia besnoiti]